MTHVPEKVREAYRELPSDWKLEKLKFYADVRNSNVDKTVSEDEEPVRLCNYTDVYYNDRITPDLQFMEGSATEAEIHRFQLKCGQVIITKDSEGWDDIGIPALVTEDMPEVLCGYHLSVFEPGPELDGGFLAWLCRAEPLNDQFKLAANGVTRFGLGQYPMKNAFIALPPLNTQRRIARFLDEKTARIDGLIEKKRTLLDRLAEKRQALITRAVTKGLDPAAPMKASGIDWLGDIPVHWEVLPLKYISPRVSVGIVVTPAAYYADEGVLAIRGLNVRPMGFDFTDSRNISEEGHELHLKSELYEGDLVAVRTGDPGTTSVITADLEGTNCVDLVIIRRPPHASSRFLGWFLNSDAAKVQYMIGSEGALQLHFNVETSKEVSVAVPPNEEQTAIAEYIDRTLENESDRAAKVERSVDLLQEYRAALITSAVTGQLAERR
ncbi:MAG: restriction endonuclease subunit S [Rhodospirillales bacterium]|nr:restriction endonuclease subunit S [Rhodospirillales bacterium]